MIGHSLSWQNSKELQLTSNKTFKSKLWQFENTIQSANNNDTNETKIIETRNETTNRKVIAKFKYTASNFALFQKEFFEDIDDYKSEQKIQRHEEADEDHDDFEDDDDQVEDGIINYDETEETEPVSSNNLINQNDINPKTCYDYSYQTQTFEAEMMSSNKKPRSDNDFSMQNYCINTMEANSTQYVSSQTFYDQNNCLAQNYDLNSKRYIYDTNEIFNNEFEIKNYNISNYDFNNNNNLNYTRSPYNLTPLQNSSYVFENTTTSHEYSNQNVYNNFNYYSNNDNNSSTSSSSTSSLCSYYNMTNLAENSATNINELNQQHFYQNY